MSIILGTIHVRCTNVIANGCSEGWGDTDREVGIPTIEVGEANRIDTLTKFVTPNFIEKVSTIIIGCTTSSTPSSGEVS
jgi:hypothetical protein